MRTPAWMRWRTDRELDEEIEAHIELDVRANLDSGLTPEQARIAAVRRFGNRTHLKESVREADPLFFFQTFFRDMLHGLRGLRRNPGFTLAAGISLALGIGANTLIFSLLDSALLKPPAFPEPERLAVVWTAPQQDPDQKTTSSISTYFGFRDRSRSFESVGAFNGAACGVATLGADQDGAPAERIIGQTFSPSLFRALGVKPVIGRTFNDDEDQVDNVAPVALIGYDLWQSRFGGNAGALGKTFTLNRAQTTVIGVLPRGFRFFGGDIAFIAPLCMTGTQSRSRVGGNTIVGRLNPGVSLAQAQAEANTIAAQMAATDPELHQGFTARVESFQRAAAKDYRSPLLILQVAVAFVLMIGCANVAGLLLARATVRRNEVAVRIALGAARGRIIRQLLAETLPLAVLGGAVGVLLCWGGLALFTAAAPADFPGLERVSLDFRVLGFTALVVLVTGSLAAIFPAIQASKVNLVDPLKESSRSSAGFHRQRLRIALVMGQVALAVILLIGAGLMIHSFVRVMHQDLGGDPTNLLVFDYRMPQNMVIKPFGRYRGLGLWDINPATALTVERVSERLQKQPGVVSVAAVNEPPMSGQAFPMQFSVEGQPPPVVSGAAGDIAPPTLNYFAVTRGFFGAMRIPLLRGRDFTEHDRAGAALVMIINQTMARRFFPGQDPIGKHVTLDFVPDEHPWEIIAVVGDTVNGPFDLRREPAVYVPHLQQPPRFTGPWSYFRTGMYFVIRTTGDPMRIVPSLKLAVAEIDPNTPVADAKPLEVTLDTQTKKLRLYMLLLGIFGAVSVLLVATGIYGVMTYSVATRTREIGIRVALGGRAGDVLSMVFRQAAWVVGIGLALGLAGSFALTGLIQSVLFDVKPADPATYGAVSVLILLIAAGACLVPARRAIQVDPTVALKYE